MPSAPADAVIVDFRGAIWRGGEIIGRAGPNTIRFRVLFLLLAGMPGVIRYADLYEAMWGDDNNGGPENARGTVALTLVIWRPVLTRLGITVKAINGFGLDVRWALPAALASDRASRTRRSETAHASRGIMDLFTFRPLYGHVSSPAEHSYATA